MSRATSVHLLLATLAAAGVLAVTGQAHAQPEVSFSTSRVVISGLTPGGDVAYLGIARERRGWTTQRIRLAGQLRDEDLDGAVELDAPDVSPTIPPVSVWIVIDLTTGSSTLASPIGPVRLRPEMLPGRLEADASGNAPCLLVSRGQVTVLVARPGAGAWAGRAGDGAKGDLDGAADGHIDLDTTVLLPLSEHGPAMDRVQAGDLIVVVDGRTLEVATATVLAAGAQGGGR